MTHTEHPTADAPAAATPTARRRFRLSVRGLMLLVAAAGLTIAYVLFVMANRDFEHAWVSHQLRTLADRSADPTARAAAVEGLRGVRGRSARRAIRLLAAALDEPDPRLRAEAAEAIARLGVPLIDESGAAATATVRPAFPALLDAIGDRDPDVAVAAIGAAGALLAAGDRNEAGTIDPEALRGRLRPLVRDPGGGAPAAARARALGLLEELGAVEDEAAVLAALDDPEPAVRLEAIGLLDRAIPAVSAPPASLLRAIGDDDPEVRAAAHWTLVRWTRGPRWVMQPRWPAARPAVVAALDRRIDRTDGDERRVLIAILSAYDPAAAAATTCPRWPTPSTTTTPTGTARCCISSSSARRPGRRCRPSATRPCGRSTRGISTMASGSSAWSPRSAPGPPRPPRCSTG